MSEKIIHDFFGHKAEALGHCSMFCDECGRVTLHRVYRRYDGETQAWCVRRLRLDERDLPEGNECGNYLRGKLQLAVARARTEGAIDG